MSTHFYDYSSAEGRFVACGRFFANDKAMPRGVAIAKSDAKVSCQACLGSDALKKARAARCSVSSPERAGK